MLADSSGVLAPPATSPLPLLRPWAVKDGSVEAAAEAALLARCNAALQALGAPPLDHLGALFAADATALATFWQLDPFGRRELAYLGWRNARPAPAAGAAAQWPAGEGARVFAMLRQSDALDATLAALRETGQPVLAVVVGLDAEAAKRASDANLRLVTDAAEASSAQHGCEVVVIHGAPAQVATLLAAGRPLVLLPRDAEQRAVARRVVELGAGRIAEGPASLAADLRALASGPLAAAQAFAARHGTHDDAAFTAAFTKALGKLVPAPAPKTTEPKGAGSKPAPAAPRRKPS
jgi:hypothetical protein